MPDKQSLFPQNEIYPVVARLVAELVAASRAPESEGDRLLRWPELRKRVPYCHSMIYRLMAQDKFPKAKALGGGRAVGWSQREVDAWIAAREVVPPPPPAHISHKRRTAAAPEATAQEPLNAFLSHLADEISRRRKTMTARLLLDWIEDQLHARR